MAKLTAYVEWDEDAQVYVGIVPGVHGAHTQGATIEELRENLAEVLALCVDGGWLTADDVPTFVGLEEVDVAV
jgi:predicted RNase H-like HicB family nuclease